jgi:hypothetical protein
MFNLTFVIEGKPALAQEFLSSEQDPVASGNCLHSPESRVADQDPHSIGLLDPDPASECGSGSSYMFFMSFSGKRLRSV